MKFRYSFFVASVSILIVSGSMFLACKGPVGPPVEETAGNSSIAYSGGQTTVFLANVDAYSTPATNLSPDRLDMHEEGDSAFETEFVPAPAPMHGGLGPIFNNDACSSCHVNDGGGIPPEQGQPLISLLLRVSISGTDAHGGPNPAPGFGGQLQQRAIAGVVPEADVSVSYSENQGMFADGTLYSLRTPTYTIANAYTSLPAGLLVSPRLAPPVFGDGLLEAIDEQTILANASANADTVAGIHGHPNYVWDQYNQKTMVGRFGLKANAATLQVQAAGAYNQDMGVTNPVFPMESCHGQSQETAKPANDTTPDIDNTTLNAAVFYIHTIGVPARRYIDDTMNIRGQQIFTTAKCANCHLPTVVTGTLSGYPELSNQTIHPYTDLLVHDMGAGLADNRPDYQASGTEWRTAPLWGIGLRQVVTGQAFYLHDGRARSLMEAILWHGGEGQYSKEYVLNLSQSDRDALISFLSSL
jgi:CxxC motif-containing protein (DUF1111 family)